MKKLLLLGVFGVNLLLQACDTGQGQPVKMTLEKPQLVKAIESSNIVADLYFDDVFDQRISFDSAEARTIGFDQVRPDTTISIQVNWYEVIDNTSLLLSRQTGSFLVTPANPNININSEHYTAFDWDGDGATNIAERRNGTCPYLTCDENGFLVDPSSISTIRLSEPFTDFVYNGGDQWSYNGTTLRTIRIARNAITMESLDQCTTCDPFRGLQVRIFLSTRNLYLNSNENDESEFVLQDQTKVISIE